jgi:hypothetical protein
MNAMVSTGAAYPDLSGPITGTVMSGWRPFDMVVNLKTAPRHRDSSPDRRSGKRGDRMRVLSGREGAIRFRVLAEKPAGRGLAVPGTPMGSPGMEMEGMAPDTYEVVLFGPSGRTTFARYEGARLL